MSDREQELTLLLNAKNLAGSAVKDLEGSLGKVGGAADATGGHFDKLGDRLVARFHRRDIKELGNAVSGSIMALATGGSLTDVIGGAGLSMGVGLASSFLVGFADKLAGSTVVQALIGPLSGLVSTIGEILAAAMGPVTAVASTIGSTIGTVISSAAALAMAIWPALLVAAIVAGIVFLVNNPEIVGKILAFAGDLLGHLGDGLASLGGLLLGLFGKAWDLVTGAVGAYVTTVANFWLGLPGLLASLPGAILHVFAMAFAAVLGFVRTIVGTIVGIINGIVGAVRSAISWVDKLVPKIHGIPAIPAIPGLPLPHFQEGTPFVPFTGPAIVHRGERIIPAGQNGAGAGGVMLQGVSERELELMIDRKMYFRLRRASPIRAG